MPKIGEKFIGTPRHLPSKSGSMLKLPPKGSAIKILPPKPIEGQEGSGQKVLKIKMVRGNSQMGGATPLVRSSSKSKIAESPTIPPKMRLKLKPRSSSRVKESKP